MAKERKGEIMKAKDYVRDICSQHLTTEEAVERVRELQFEDFDRDIQSANYDLPKSEEVLKGEIPEFLDGNPAVCTNKWHKSQFSVVRSQLKEKETGESLGEDNVPKRSFLNSGEKDEKNRNLHLRRDSSFGFNYAMVYLKGIIARMVEHCNSYSEKMNEIENLSFDESEELNQKLEERNFVALDMIESNLSIMDNHRKDALRDRLLILLNRL